MHHKKNSQLTLRKLAVCSCARLSCQQIIRWQENHKKEDIHYSKVSKVATSVVSVVFCNVFEGNQTGHGSDQGSKSAYIRPQNQLSILICKTRQKQCRRNVTNHLAGKHCNQHLMSFQGIHNHISEGWNSSQISYKHKEKHKSKQEGVIHIF